MADDHKALVERLRRAFAGKYYGNMWDLCDEAADAIERLAADAERYKAALRKIARGGVVTNSGTNAKTIWRHAAIANEALQEFVDE